MPTITIDDLRSIEDTEIQRLLTKELSESELSTVDTYYRAKWTTASREKHKSSGGYFAGPGTSYPLKDCSDASDAWGLAGHADNSDQVRKNIKQWAGKHGCSLPASAKEDGKSEKADTPDITRAGDPGLEIGADGNHKPFSGLHIHHHNAFDSQGDDKQHEHQHKHSNDANHNHRHSASEEEKADTPDILRAMPPDTTFYAPILRIDREKREVVLRATAEAFDSYGTVIGFDGSKAAFGKWRGNIREMHDPTKAVGRSIKYDPVEHEKAIDLTLRVSKGAEDTWQKVLDGTLAGGSIGARNGVWGKRVIDGKEVPFLERYDLVEVSLVDNPSCPGCDIKIVRADGMATDVLDFTEETTPPEQQQADIQRAGARVATNTMMSMHKSRDHAAQALRETLANCSCDQCQGALRTLDPDGDGDIDIIPSLDTDHDGAGQAGGDGSGIMKYVQTEITRYLAPVIQRFNGIAAIQAAAGTHTTTIQEPDPELTRCLASLEQKLAGLDEVRSLVSEVKQLAEQIAAQPQPGGPIVNSAALRSQTPDTTSDPHALEAEVIARLARSGILNKDQQVNAVMYLQRLQQQGMSARR